LLLFFVWWALREVCAKCPLEKTGAVSRLKLPAKRRHQLNMPSLTLCFVLEVSSCLKDASLFPAGPYGRTCTLDLEFSRTSGRSPCGDCCVCHLYPLDVSATSGRYTNIRFLYRPRVADTLIEAQAASSVGAAASSLSLIYTFNPSF
jgi:hypothetical protein